MAYFVPNLASNKKYGDQFSEYLQGEAFVGDITSQIANSSALQSREIKEAAEMICGSVENGLNQLEDSFGQMSSMLDQRMTLMVEAQNVSNILSQNIAALMRIPDVQKERQYFIEQGLKHFKNAAKNPDLLNDSLENLLKAEEIEKTDYIVLHRIGLIYLYSHKLLNLEKAEDYLKRAAKYAAVEGDPDAERIANLLSAKINTNLANFVDDVNSIKKLAAESFFHAGVSCYAQGNFDEAVKLTENAIECMPHLLEAGFMKAKALIALNKEKEAVNILKPIIETKPIYSVKTATEEDLAKNSGIQKLLKNLHEDAVNKAKKMLEKCKNEMIKTSLIKDTINEVEKLVNNNTYIHAIATLEILTKKRNLCLTRKELNSKYKTKMFSRIETEDELLDEDILKFECNVCEFILKEKEIYQKNMKNKDDAKLALEKFKKEEQKRKEKERKQKEEQRIQREEERQEKIKLENESKKLFTENKELIFSICDKYRNVKFYFHNIPDNKIQAARQTFSLAIENKIIAIGETKILFISTPVFAITNSGIHTDKFIVLWNSFIDSNLEFRIENGTNFCYIAKTYQNIKIYDKTAFVFFQQLQSALKNNGKYKDTKQQHKTNEIPKAKKPAVILGKNQNSKHQTVIPLDIAKAENKKLPHTQPIKANKIIIGKLPRVAPISAFAIFCCLIGYFWTIINYVQMCSGIKLIKKNAQTNIWTIFLFVFSFIGYSNIIKILNEIIEENNLNIMPLENNDITNFIFPYIPLSNIFKHYNNIVEAMEQ